MVGDLSEDPSEPCLRIDVVEFGGFDKREGDGHGFTPPSEPANIQMQCPFCVGLQVQRYAEGFSS